MLTGTMGMVVPIVLAIKSTMKTACKQLIQTLAKEWHPTKNSSLTPKDVTAGSNKKVWWQCSRGHEWEAGIGK